MENKHIKIDSESLTQTIKDLSEGKITPEQAQKIIQELSGVNTEEE